MPTHNNLDIYHELDSNGEEQLNLSKLSRVLLTPTFVRDQLEPYLMEHENIRTLIIARLKLYYLKQLLPAIAQLTSISALKLPLTYLPDKAVELLIQHLAKNIRHLDLSNNAISDKGATLLAQRATQLVSLNLANNKISDEGATLLAQHATQLTSIDLSNNQKIGDAGAKALINNPNLQMIKLAGKNLVSETMQNVLQSNSLCMRANYFRATDGKNAIAPLINHCFFAIRTQLHTEQIVSSGLVRKPIRPEEVRSTVSKGRER